MVSHNLTKLALSGNFGAGPVKHLLAITTRHRTTRMKDVAKTAK
jgi:hypothetical protein